MRRLIPFLLALGLFLRGQPVAAQVLTTNAINIVSSGGACTAVPLACATTSITGAPTVTLQVSGTFSGTLTFEGTADGLTWTSVIVINTADGTSTTTTTAPGAFSFVNSGFLSVRARATAWVSGTANVTTTRGWLSARVLAPIFSSGFFADGSAGAPSIAFQSEPTLGFRRSAAGVVTLQGALVTTGAITGVGSITTSATGAFGFAGRGFLQSPAVGNFTLSNTALTIGVTLKVDNLPTVGGGFGTSPNVVALSTPLAGGVDVGTGGTATTGVIAFGGTAFPSVPFCTLGQTAGTFTTYVATVSQLTLTAAVAWPASTVVTWHCISSR